MIAFVYQVLGVFDIVSTVSEDSVVNLFTMFVNILAFVGVVIDPTTEGFYDSDRAMLYFTDYDERIVE